MAQGANSTPREVLLRKVDPSKNMARFYAVSIEMSLFNDPACVKQFGRIGGRGGRIMIGLYETEDEAMEEFNAILRRKLLRGYQEQVLVELKK